MCSLVRIQQRVLARKLGQVEREWKPECVAVVIREALLLDVLCICLGMVLGG